MTDNVLDISTGKPVTPVSQDTAISLEMKRLEQFALKEGITSYAIVMIDKDGEHIIGHDIAEGQFDKAATALWSLFNEVAELSMGYEEVDDLDELDFEE